MGVAQQPEVQRAISRATDQVLQNAVLSREIAPSVTDAALKAKYDADVANKPGEEEVHARHILVDNEDAAKKIIDQLNKGGDFADPGQGQQQGPGGAEWRRSGVLQEGRHGPGVRRRRLRAEARPNLPDAGERRSSAGT